MDGAVLDKQERLERRQAASVSVQGGDQAAVLVRRDRVLGQRARKGVEQVQGQRVAHIE
jgi:hypothetical protein